MPTRDERAAIARETLAILEKGFYEAPSGEQISIRQRQNYAEVNTTLYRPDEFTILEQKIQLLLDSPPLLPTHIEVRNETTLQAAERLLSVHSDSEVCCLNFASAKNPGGGFLGGSQAQEESLARSSGLYPCLLEKKEMYEANKNVSSCLYTDHMIYSPGVPVFRNDEGRLLEQPYVSNFITAPAVNVGCLKQNEAHHLDQVEEVMSSRCDKVLSVALNQAQDTLVLGAWGCGVFQNDPHLIATCFAKLLLNEGRYVNRFEHIVFAVLDTSDSKATFNAFMEVFQI